MSTPKLPFGYPQCPRGNVLSMDGKDWLKSLNTNVNAAETVIGAGKGSLSKYMNRNGGQLSADYVIRIARAYRVSPVRAMLDMGILTRDEVMLPSTADKEAVLREVLRDIGTLPTSAPKYDKNPPREAQ